MWQRLMKLTHQLLRTGYALAWNNTRVQRLGIADQDELRSTNRKRLSGPVEDWIFSERQFGEFASLYFGERRMIIVALKLTGWPLTS